MPDKATTTEQQPPTPQALLDAIDAVHYSAACGGARHEAELASWGMRHAREHVETLSCQPEVPLAQRVQYRRMTRAISALEGRLKKALADLDLLPMGDIWRDDYLIPMEPTPDAQTVQQIKRIICSLNLAEQGFFASCKRAFQAAQASDTAAWIDWGRHGFEFEVSVELKLPPERAFYATCVNDDTLRIPVPGFTVTPHLNPIDDDHNLFRDPQNPFYGDHHGYLVHCLVEHSALPLALFPLIESVEMDMRFNDFLTLWRRVPSVVNEGARRPARL